MVVAAIDELKKQAQRRVELTFAEPVDPAVFTALESVRNVEAFNHTITVTVTGSVDPVFKAAARYQVETVISHEGDLESAFLAYYEGGGDAP